MPNHYSTLIKADATLDDAAFRFVEHTFATAYLHHGRNLFAAHCSRLVFRSENLGDEFRKQYQRICDEDQHSDDACRNHSEAAPIGCTNGLRYNFRQHQNQQSENSGYNSEILFAEDFDALSAHTGRTDCVGYGVL